MSFNNKTILITGGTGFLGSNLLKKLVQQQITLIVLKRSTSKLSRINTLLPHLICYNINEVPLEQIFQKYTIDILIHCATNYGYQLEKVTDAIESNLLLPLHLLQLCLNYGKPIFINTDTILDKRVSIYSRAKKQFLEWLTLFSSEMPCINLSLEHFYGPLDDRTKFCTKIMLDLLSNAKEINLTPGMQKRDFIYIDDVVDAFITILNYSLTISSGFHHFEVGTGSNITIKDFVTLVRELTGNTTTQLNFGALSYRPNEIMEYKVNLNPLRSLGWKPNFTLIEGLTKTIRSEKEFSKEGQRESCLI